MKATISSLIYLLSLSAFTFAENIEKTYPWTEYDVAVVTPTEKIKPGCGTLSMDEKSLKNYKPEFPVDGFKARTSGYSVFDFQIDETGKPKNIELVGFTSKAKSGFQKESQKKLKSLQFNLSEEWLKSCSEQKYRIGYAYRLMSDCTYAEFPKPIINVCVTGMMQVIR